MRAENPVHHARPSRVWTAIVRDSASYFLWSTANYGLIFFLPKILTARGASPLATGWWATLTFGVGAFAMFAASRNRGFRSLPILFLVAGLGFAAVALVPSLAVSLAGFCVAAIGLMASVPMFWSLSSSRLTGKAAGAAIAIVNSMGAVGGFAGPYAMGWLRDATHAYTAGLWAIAVCLALGAVLVLVDARSSPAPVLAPAGQR
jgi:predicted MFS family arabinose efflux permease